MTSDPVKIGSKRMNLKRKSQLYQMARRPPLFKKKKIKSAFILLGTILVTYIFVGGDYGFYRIWRQKAQIASLKEDIDDLKEDNERLEREIELLQNDMTYIEKIAREEYGMHKEGETVYRISWDGEWK